MSAPILVGLTAASDGAAAMISVAEVLSQLPEIARMTPGAQVVILPGLNASTGLFARIFGRKKRVPRAVRCSALLARGFIDIAAAGAGDDDLVWGFAPPLS